MRTTGTELSCSSAGLSHALVRLPRPSTNAHGPGHVTGLSWPLGRLIRFRCSSRNLRSLCSRFWAANSSAAAGGCCSSAPSTGICGGGQAGGGAGSASSRTAQVIPRGSRQAGRPHRRPRPHSVCGPLSDSLAPPLRLAANAPTLPTAGQDQPHPPPLP